MKKKALTLQVVYLNFYILQALHLIQVKQYRIIRNIAYNYVISFDSTCEMSNIGRVAICLLYARIYEVRSQAAK